MSTDDLPRNLRLLCSYSPSVTEACRRIGINRQQFNKYLAGENRPSLRNLRRIGDYFGLEESELLLDGEAFARLIAIKRPTPGRSAIEERIREILLLTEESSGRLEQYTGFYHNYFCPREFPGQVLRGLIQVSEQGGIVFSSNVERYPRDPHRSTRKYNGIFMHSGERIIMFEREATVGKMLWLTILYAFDRDQPSLMPGLTVGVTSRSSRDIVFYRVILQRLGQEVDVREALGRCGLFRQDDPSLDPTIRSRIINEMQPGEPVFEMRL